MTRQVPRIKVRYPTKATPLLIKIDVVNNDTGSCHIQLPDYVVGGELSSIFSASSASSHLSPGRILMGIKARVSPHTWKK